MTEYIILRATLLNGMIATALIEQDTYKELQKFDALEPKDFFPRASKARVVGKIQVTGDIEQLDDTYISD